MHIDAVHTEYNFIRRTVELYLRYRGPENALFYATIEQKPYDPAASLVANEMPEPIRLESWAAQDLMDKLWQCGLRPSEGTGSAGAMKQAEDHIKSLKQHIEHLITIMERLSNEPYSRTSETEV